LAHLNRVTTPNTLNKLCGAQVPSHGRCALLCSGLSDGEHDLERVLRCIGACAAHSCGVQAASPQPLLPLLSDAALRTLRATQRGLCVAHMGLPPLAKVSAVAREVAACLGGLHDVAARQLRPQVLIACLMFDLLLGVAVGIALLANSALVEAAVRHATGLLLTHLPSRGCANVPRLCCVHAAL